MAVAAWPGLSLGGAGLALLAAFSGAGLAGLCLTLLVDQADDPLIALSGWSLPWQLNAVQPVQQVTGSTLLLSSCVDRDY